MHCIYLLSIIISHHVVSTAVHSGDTSCKCPNTEPERCPGLVCTGNPHPKLASEICEDGSDPPCLRRVFKRLIRRRLVGKKRQRKAPRAQSSLIYTAKAPHSAKISYQADPEVITSIYARPLRLDAPASEPTAQRIYPALGSSKYSTRNQYTRDHNLRNFGNSITTTTLDPFDISYKAVRRRASFDPVDYPSEEELNKLDRLPVVREDSEGSSPSREVQFLRTPLASPLQEKLTRLQPLTEISSSTSESTTRGPSTILSVSVPSTTQKTEIRPVFPQNLTYALPQQQTRLKLLSANTVQEESNSNKDSENITTVFNNTLALQKTGLNSSTTTVSTTEGLPMAVVDLVDKLGKESVVPLSTSRKVDDQQVHKLQEFRRDQRLPEKVVAEIEQLFMEASKRIAKKKLQLIKEKEEHQTTSEIKELPELTTLVNQRDSKDNKVEGEVLTSSESTNTLDAAVSLSSTDEIPSTEKTKENVNITTTTSTTTTTSVLPTTSSLTTTTVNTTLPVPTDVPTTSTSSTTTTTTTPNATTEMQYKKEAAPLTGLDLIVADVSLPEEIIPDMKSTRQPVFGAKGFKVDVTATGYKSNPRFAAEEVSVDEKKCNDDTLLKLLVDNMEVDNSIGSKRSLAAALGVQGAQKVSVLCSEQEMAFRLVARKYCQLTAGTVTCLAFIL